jgi:alanine dehydrogenase
MRIGVPKELKPQELRVALTPAGVRELVAAGHEVLVEEGAGRGSWILDEDYRAAGATVLADADELWGQADLVCKVKEPVAEEYARLRRDLVLFAYLHLAASRACTDALLAAGTTAIAYETVELADGSLPLLAPMSEIAGKMAPLVGAHSLLRSQGGRGVLVSGAAGVRGSRVAVLGAGVVGRSAVAVAVGLGAQVAVLDSNLARLRELDRSYRGRVETLAASAAEVERVCLGADLVIGAVLVPGAVAPKLVSERLVRAMRPGSVLVDVSVDQGGCFEPTRPTTHAQPTFSVGDSLLYCVANMPGAVPETATHALANATLPYVLEIAHRGWKAAVAGDAALARGVSAVGGRLVAAAVAEAHGLPVVGLTEVLA